MFRRVPWLTWLSLALLGLPSLLRAQPDTLPPQADAPVAGSTAFCLFEVPMDPERRVWLNLGIVQYIELRADGLRIFYGGGNLGSGHEFHLRASRDEGLAFLQKMQAAAVRCAGNGPAPGPSPSSLTPLPNPDSAPPPPGESHPPPGG